MSASAIEAPNFDRDGIAGVMEWCTKVKELGKSEGVEVTARDLVITARKDFPSEDVPAVVKCIKELYKDEYTQDKPTTTTTEVKTKVGKPSKPPIANKATAKASKPAGKANGKETPPKASKAPVKGKNGNVKDAKPAKAAKKAVAKGDAKVITLKNKTGLDVKLLKLPSGVTQATIEGFSLRPAIRGMAAAGMENKAIKAVMEKAGFFDKGVNPVGAKMSFESVINDHGASGRSYVSTKGKKFWHGVPAELPTKLVSKLKALAKA